MNTEASEQVVLAAMRGLAAVYGKHVTTITAYKEAMQKDAPREYVLGTGISPDAPVSFLGVSLPASTVLTMVQTNPKAGVDVVKAKIIVEKTTDIEDKYRACVESIDAARRALDSEVDAFAGQFNVGKPKAIRHAADGTASSERIKADWQDAQVRAFKDAVAWEAIENGAGREGERRSNVGSGRSVGRARRNHHLNHFFGEVHERRQGGVSWYGGRDMDSDSQARGNERQIEQPRPETMSEADATNRGGAVESGDAFLYAMLNLNGADMDMVDAIFGQ